jgi:hypothetical protein
MEAALLGVLLGGSTTLHAGAAAHTLAPTALNLTTSG